MRTDRRSTLSLIGASALAGVAGCIDVDGMLDGGSADDRRDDRDRRTDDGTASSGDNSGGGFADQFVDDHSAEEWLFGPSALQMEHYETMSLDAAGLQAQRSSLQSSFLTDLESLADPFPGVEFDDFDTMIMPGELIEVALGDFDATAIVDSATDAEYAEVEEYEGYSLLERDHEALAIGDSALIRPRPWRVPSPVEAIQFTIDAGHGEGTRYTEENDHLETLLDALEISDIQWFETREAVVRGNPEIGRFENQVASGASYDVQGDWTDGRAVVVFVDSSDVSDDDIETWIDESISEVFSDVDHYQDDRAVVVTGQLETSELDRL